MAMLVKVLHTKPRAEKRQRPHAPGSRYSMLQIEAGSLVCLMLLQLEVILTDNEIKSVKLDVCPIAEENKEKLEDFYNFRVE